MNAFFPVSWSGPTLLLVVILVGWVLLCATVCAWTFTAYRRGSTNQVTRTVHEETPRRAPGTLEDDLFTGEEFTDWSPLHKLRARYAHGDLDEEAFERLDAELQRGARNTRSPFRRRRTPNVWHHVL